MTQMLRAPISEADAKAFYDNSLREADKLSAKIRIAQQQKDAEEQRQSLLAATNLTERQLTAIKLWLELY